MLRMILSIILSFVVVLGFASKELKASELMNHVNEEHVTHSHDHSHSHTHHHDHHDDEDEENEDDTTKDHSHLYDISALNPVWNIKPTQFESVEINFVLRELQTLSMESSLLLKNIPLSIFRPPIS